MIDQNSVQRTGSSQGFVVVKVTVAIDQNSLPNNCPDKIESIIEGCAQGKICVWSVEHSVEKGVPA